MKIWGENTYLKGRSHEVRWELSQTAARDHRCVTKIHKKHLHTYTRRAIIIDMTSCFVLHWDIVSMYTCVCVWHVPLHCCQGCAVLWLYSIWPFAVHLWRGPHTAGLDRERQIQASDLLCLGLLLTDTVSLHCSHRSESPKNGLHRSPTNNYTYWPAHCSQKWTKNGS